jgi:hypothetical protein
MTVHTAFLRFAWMFALPFFVSCGGAHPASLAGAGRNTALVPTAGTSVGTVPSTSVSSAVSTSVSTGVAPPSAVTVLARSLGIVRAMAVDSTYVYLAKSSEVVRVPLRGGEPVLMTKLEPGDEAFALTAASEGLYLATAGTGDATVKAGRLGMGSVMLLPAGSSEPRALATYQVRVQSIVLDDKNVYWAAELAGVPGAWVLRSAGRNVKAEIKTKALPRSARLAQVHGHYNGEVLASGVVGGVVAHSLSGAKKEHLVGLLPRVVFANILGDRLIVAGLDVDASGRPVSVVGMTGLLGASQEITRLETFDGAVRIGGLSSRDKLVYFTKTGRHRDRARPV